MSDSQIGFSLATDLPEILMLVNGIVILLIFYDIHYFMLIMIADFFFYFSSVFTTLFLV